MTDIPFIGFDNEQIKNAKDIKEGDVAPCPKCGTLVEIKNANSREKNEPVMQFIRHCDKLWLIGLRGKLLQNVKPTCSGTINIEE